MSLVEVYDALKSANVSDEKASAAVKAIESGQDKEWKSRVETRLVRLEVGVAILIVMISGLYVQNML